MVFKVKGKGKPISVISEKTTVDTVTGKKVTGAVETPIKAKEVEKEEESIKEEDS